MSGWFMHRGRPVRRGDAANRDGAREAPSDGDRPFIVVHRPLPDGARWAMVLLGLFITAIAAIALGRAPERTPPALWPPVDNFASLLSDPRGLGLPDSLSPAWLPDSLQPGRLPDRRPRPLSEDARAVRIGARIADLGIVGWARNHAARSADAGDASAIAYAALQCSVAAAIAHELATNMDEMPHGAAGATFFRWTESEARRGATISPHELRSATEIAHAVHPGGVTLGNWLETARVAALRGDRAFFLRPDVQAEAIHSAALEDVPLPARVALATVRRLAIDDSARNLAALAHVSGTALRVLVY